MGISDPSIQDFIVFWWKIIFWTLGPLLLLLVVCKVLDRIFDGKKRPFQMPQVHHDIQPFLYKDVDEHRKSRSIQNIEIMERDRWMKSFEKKPW